MCGCSTLLDRIYRVSELQCLSGKLQDSRALPCPLNKPCPDLPSLRCRCGHSPQPRRMPKFHCHERCPQLAQPPQPDPSTSLFPGKLPAFPELCRFPLGAGEEVQPSGTGRGARGAQCWLEQLGKNHSQGKTRANEQQFGLRNRKQSRKQLLCQVGSGVVWIQQAEMRLKK